MSLLCNLQFSSHKVVTRRLSLRSILNGVQLCSQILSLHSLNLLVVQVPYLLSVTRVLVRKKLFDQGKNLSNSIRQNVIIALCPYIPGPGIAPLALYGQVRLYVYH